MKITNNYKKHKNNNPLQKYLLNNFYNSLISIIKDLNFGSFDFAQDKIDIKSILDAGCGEGFTLNKLYENKIGQKLEGIDFSKDAISLGKKLYPFLNLRQANIYKLPYKDNSFDLVVCSEVLEHLKHPVRAYEEILRVSRKYCLLSVPSEPFFRLSNFLRGKNLSRLGNDIEHINHWSSRSFEKFVKQEKVKVIKKKSPFPWTIVLIEKI